MNRLDEVYGPLGWKREHEIIGASMFCAISVWDSMTSQWISKQDVGTESMAEAKKGEASDAFKRAGFNWGIGRELYDYPVISIKLNQNEWKQSEYQGKKKNQATWEFRLKEWYWESGFTLGKITYLAAWDNNKKGRFQWGHKSDG